MNKPSSDFFNKDMAQKYDERNSKLSRISEALHFLTGLALKDLPEKSRILSVGAGTGAEILFLAQTFPHWTFVASEPSIDMLNICRERLQQAGVAERCEFIHGYVQDVPQKNFDAVITMLVAHFIPAQDRADFFKQMVDRLRSGGYLVNAEISFDLNSPEFPTMLKGWEAVQSLMGATPESLAALPTLLKEKLTLLPPEETATLLREQGIPLPVQFFQALMICGWYGKKS